MAKKDIQEFIGVGRRKTAVSAIRLRKGIGKIDINGREMKDYFPTSLQREIVISPFVKMDLVNKYDLIIRLKGGGIEAISLDHDLGSKQTGYDVVVWIEREVATNNFEPPLIYVHTDNPVGRKKIETAIEKIREFQIRN